MSTASAEKPKTQKTELSRYARAFSEKRRGVRMNSRVPIAVEWEDSQGQKIRSKAVTCVVSSYGCLVVLLDNLALDQQVVIVNLVNEQTIPGTIVWRGNLRDGGWELGVELSQPPADFWGLEL